MELNHVTNVFLATTLILKLVNVPIVIFRYPDALRVPTQVFAMDARYQTQLLLN